MTAWTCVPGTLLCRELLREQHITPRVTRKGIESRQRLGRHRWVVERSFAWHNRIRRLTVRFEGRTDSH